jgi:hypothetical protein
VRFRNIAHGAPMIFRGSRALACALALSIVAVSLAACGGGSDSKSISASDKASGVTVSVAGDQVTLKRTAKSTAGSGATAGQVACTDDYTKLLKATAQPAPNQPWYSATLIAWPAANKQSTATLSHELKGDPDLCIAQTSDSNTQVVVYFSDKAKTGIQNAQAENTRNQQAAQASTALKAAAQAAVATVNKGSFPAAASIVQTVAGQGLYVREAANLSDVTQTGTMYVITGQTTTHKLVIALKDSKGAVQIATQGLKGSAKLATAKQ